MSIFLRPQNLYWDAILNLMDKAVLEIAQKLEAKRGVPTFLLFSGISYGAMLKTRQSVEGTQAEEIDIILHSPGGQPEFAYRLIRTFRHRYKTVNVVVPFWAKSAATLFAFGATKLALHEHGELGPLDAQIRKEDDESASDSWVSALLAQSSLEQIEKRSMEGMLEMFAAMHSNEEIKIGRRPLAEMLLNYSAQFYKPLLEKIETIELGTMARYLDIGKMYAQRILKQYTEIDDERMLDLTNFLVYECPDHGYVVDYDYLQGRLPNVIMANESPFDAEYYGILDQLSMLLMAYPTIPLEIVGFVSNLTAPPVVNDGTIPNKENGHASETKQQEGNSNKLPSSKSDEDEGEKDAGKNPTRAKK